MKIVVSKNTQILKFLENYFCGSRMFNADGQTDSHTDKTKLIDTFRNCTNAPKNRIKFQNVLF